MKRLFVIMLALLMLPGSCMAEALNERWARRSDDDEPPEAIYYPEFTLHIPEKMKVQGVYPDGDMYYGEDSYRVEISVSYVPYSELDYAVDVFDENTFTPGSYEFGRMFGSIDTGNYDNQIDCLYSIRVDDRYGMLVCKSRNGQGMDVYNRRYGEACIPGENGYIHVSGIVSGEEADVEQACLLAIENLTYEKGDIVISRCDYEPYMKQSFEALSPEEPLEWRCVLSPEKPDMVWEIAVGIAYDLQFHYEVDDCKLEINLLAADGLENENVEFSVDAEYGVWVSINGVERRIRPLKGLENGSAEYVTLDDGVRALIYTAEYAAPARTLYFQGAVFVCADGVAMPFISSQQPIPDGLLEEAIGLYE